VPPATAEGVPAESARRGIHGSDPLTRAGDAQPQNDVRVLPRITSAMVRNYKEQFGRGPENARASFAGPDMIVCVLAARRVVSFMSAVDVERDLASEIFMLEPRPRQQGVTPA
jgi:uncharacterized protein YbcI